MNFYLTRAINRRFSPYTFLIFLFILFISTSKLNATDYTIDLSVSLTAPTTTIEAGKVFHNHITLSNQNPSNETDIYETNEKIEYTLPTGASYNTSSGTGWSCTSDSTTVTCTYAYAIHNASSSNTLDLQITAPSSVGTITPSVTAVANTIPDPNSSNDTTSLTFSVGKSNLHATKTASKTPLQLNEAFTYTINVTNPDKGTTTVAARDVTLSDTLPANISFVSFNSTPSGWSCSESSGTISCSGLDLAVGDSKSLVINVKAPASSNEQPIANTARLNTDSSDYNTMPLEPSAAVVVQAADIVLTSSLINGIDASNAGVGSNVIYRLHVINNGASPAYDVTLSDTLPAGVTLSSYDNTNWTCSGSSTINCTLKDTTLAYHEAYDLDLHVTMPTTHQSITNNATASTTTGELSTTNNSTTLTTQVLGADLNIVKKPDNGSTDIGTEYTYTIKTTNAGEVAADNVVVTDTLDPDMSFISDSAGCSRSGQTLTCTKTSMAPGETWSFTVKVKMPTTSLDDVTNTASVTTDTDQQNTTNTSDTVTTHIKGPNLNITKSANVTDVGLGKTFSYTINVSNVNTAPASDADIEDQLPSGVSIINILSNDGWNCPATPITGTFHCTKATIPGSSSSSITFEAQAPSATTGTVQNTAKISHSLNSNDGTDTANVNVTGVVLTIDKVATPIVEAGGLIDYNITVTNTSHSDAQSLTLSDNLATSLGAGYTINSVINSDGWSCSGVGTSALNCTRPTLLAEGASSTIHFKVNVPYNATLGTRTNTASVTTTTTPQPTVSDSASTEIQGADIVVIPPTTTTAVANENVVFSVEVRNDGSATAKDVNITNFFNTANTTDGDFTNILIDCNGGTNYTTGAPYTCQLGDIAKNASKIITISATAPNYDSNFPGNSDILNKSQAVTSTSQSNTSNDTQNWGVEVHGANIVVFKDVDKTNVALKGTVTYTIHVENQWEAVANNITLDDYVTQSGTDGFKLKTSTLSAGAGWTCSNVTDTGFSCSYAPSLALNASTTDITIEATAPNDINAIDQVRSNEANVSTTTAEKEIATSNHAIAGTTIRGADLGITKSVLPTTAQLNESVTYTIKVTNTGLATATNAYVDDTLLNGFTNISTNGCTNDGSNVSGQTVHCTLGDLAQNASKSFTITTNAPNTNGTYLNTATTGSETLEKNTANNTASVNLDVEGADLAITKTAPARVAGHSTYGYTINLQNIGHSPAYGAEINDTIPSNVTYVNGSLSTLSSDWTCSINGSNITCHTNDSNLTIPVGYNQNIVSFNVTAGPAHDWVYNTATTATDTSESRYDNNTDTATTEVINIDLQAAKTINGSYYGTTENYVAIDGTLKYDIYVRNAPISGTTPPGITDVNVTDILPDNITNISVTPDARFTCNNPTTAGATLFCTMNDGLNTPLTVANGWVLVATVNSNAFNAASFDINDENENFIVNRYKAETSLSDQNLGNNAPTTGDGYLHTNTLVRGANMSIVKTVSADPVGANQSFSYTLATRNYPRTGTAAHDIPSTTADTIVVKDTLPANVNFISASGTNWNCTEASHILTCSYGNTVAPSNSAPDITVNVTTPNSTGEVLSNEANVTNSTPELTRLLPDNTDTITTTTQGTDISITKSGPAIAGMSDVVTYSVTVTNSSSVPASDIYVLDTFPNGATYDGNISNSHWSLGTDVNGSKKFIYDQNLSGHESTTFTFNSTLPHYTGTARNDVEAFTSTVETSTPNKASWETTIQGGDIVFANDPTQSPNPVGAYGAHQYFISIKNQGLSDAKDINVTFSFNNMSATPGWSDVNASGTGWNCDAFDANNSKIICHLPTLAKSSTANPITISSIAPNYNGNITNTAVVVGSDDANNTTGQSKVITTTIRGADLKITKYAHDPDPLSDGLYHDNNITVGVGKTVDFKLSVENIDKGLAKDITLTDVMPNGFSDFNITNPGDWNCSFASDTLTCTRSTLAPNTTATDILVSAKTSGSIGNVTNVADINSSTAEVDNSNNNDDVKIKLEGATLNATFDAPKTQVALGEIYTYVLDINNTGRNPAIDVNTTDILPADLTYIDNNGSDSDWSCTATGNTVACTQPLIQAYSGESILRLNVKAPANKIGTYTNAVDINSNSIENPINATAPDVRVIGADLNVSINATPTDVLEDRNVTYNINVSDINISTAHNVVLKQTFSKTINALYITSGASDCNLTDSNQSVTCNYSTLDYNQNKNITVVATMPNTNTLIDPLTSTVEVTTPTPQENLVSHTASVDVKVYPIKPDVDYRFEECSWDGSNGEVVDSINGVNGKAKNGAQTINHILAYDDNNFSTAWRSGSFDGSNDYIDIPDNTLINTAAHNKRSISLWFDSNTTTANNRNKIIYEEGGSARGLAIYLRGSNLYVGGWNQEGGWSSGTYLYTPIQINKWNHVVLTLDAEDSDTLKSGAFHAYLNGISFGSGDGTRLNAHSDDTGIGYVNGGTKLNNNKTIEHFQGYIDEVEIYNIALDARAVKNIYNYEKALKNYDGTDRPETICGVDLSVIKTSNPSGNVGAESNLAYTITVTNLSNEPVTKGFTLTDTLPPNVSYTSESHSINLNCTGTNSFNCTFPDTLILRKNESETFTLNAQTANVDKVNITNTATATATNQPDENSANNSDTAQNYIIGTDLKITKTASPIKPNPGSAFVYTVRVDNISTYADAQNITITDHFDSRLSYVGITTNTNESNATVSCTTPVSNTFSCSMNHLSMGNNVELYVTMISPNQASGLTNDASVSSSTVDTNMNNNDVNTTIDTNTSATSVDILRPSLKYFNNDVSVNKYGNIATIGNTILVPQNYDGSQNLDEVNSTYAHSVGGYTNASSALLHIVDTNTSNPEDNITIEYAGLFWGGHLHGDDKNETGDDIPFNSVKLITPDGSVHNITVAKTDLNGTADPSNRADYYQFKKGDEDANNTDNIGNYRIFYGAKADITDIIKNLNGNINGNYTVADMQVTQGRDTIDFAPSTTTENNVTQTSWKGGTTFGYFGGWTMVVAYSVNHRYHREVKFKNLSVFSGFVDLVPPGPGGQAKLPIDISGFITPISGDIESSLYDFVQGGDKQISLEGMTIDDKNGTANAVIEDTNNTDNLFNDTITFQDVNNNLITKNPGLTYNLGNDMDQYNLSSNYDGNGSCTNTDGRPCYLSHSQNHTKATIAVNESDVLSGIAYPSEQAFVQMLSMQTQIFAPDFIDSYKECFKLKEPLNPAAGWNKCSDPSPQLRRGDIVKYRLTILNTGDDSADDVYITDALPRELTYENNSSVVTNLTPFQVGSPCEDPTYNSSESTRDQCAVVLKDRADSNDTNATYVLDPNLINHSYSDTTYDVGSNTLVYSFSSFAQDHVAWIEFNATINSLATFGKTFSNSMSITFTNPTLKDYNLSGGTVTQVSLPVESSPVYFNWDNIVVVAKDIGRSTVGAKVVNAPFDLNISLGGISALDVDANTSIFINSLRIKDIYNGTSKDIYPTVVDANVGIPLTDINNIHWLTSGTTYDRASRELGFDLNISIGTNDGNHTESKLYPDDFNSSAPYAGDVFTTRPASFDINLTGATHSGAYYIVNSGASNLGLDIHAPDYNGSNDSLSYNASLSKAAGNIDIGLDSAFSTNNACIDSNEFNISTANFTDGFATASNAKYSNVGVIKLVVKDSNWTYRDSIVGDCNASSIGQNDSSAGLISCSVDGNSTSIVFQPDHFEFTNTTVNDYNDGFTYMVNQPIIDPMYATIDTTVEAKNVDNNTTTFFSSMCFANDVDVALTYNAQSKDLSALRISIANDQNTSDMTTDNNISATNNHADTVAYDNNFTSGTSAITLRMAVERNATTPIQPALIDAQTLKGSITSYLGIALADVTAGAGTDINATNDIHFYYGRVHAPDYRFAGNSGKAIVYYEVYCKDCTPADRNLMSINGGESIDSINWYINTKHANVIDGNVSRYSTVENVRFGTNYASGSDDTNATLLGNPTNGTDTLDVVADPNNLPYIDKVEINATDWITYDPKDFILEFQEDGKEWAGQGKLGHVIDTNVSTRSNRRLNW
ncbi:LamG-like jellyroll fold domain-containing protein [Sulfurospirillum sp. 1612]|uniref:LamG-like jellyroll fold domain-containing protein n=1 Tax=Sulfurospirillum sp. 1612 TaxID=3094835 RepID=UPI002F934C31